MIIVVVGPYRNNHQAGVHLLQHLSQGGVFAGAVIPTSVVGELEYVSLEIRVAIQHPSPSLALHVSCQQYTLLTE